MRQPLELTIDGESLGEVGCCGCPGGVRLVYNLTREVGNRLVSAEVSCDDCDGDRLEALEDDKVYNIVTLNFSSSQSSQWWWRRLHNAMLKENFENRKSGSLIRDVIRKVIEVSSPVSARVEGRITIIKVGSDEDKVVSGANPIDSLVNSRTGS